MESRGIPSSLYDQFSVLDVFDKKVLEILVPILSAPDEKLLALGQ